MKWICLIIIITQITQNTKKITKSKKTKKMSKKIIIRIPRICINTNNNANSRNSSDDNSRNTDDNANSRIRQSRTSERVKELVGAFATEHCAISCKMFKESWNKWIHSGEIDSLLNQNYNNNRDEIENKLFFSARYYHRKKTIKAQKEDTQSMSQEDNNSQVQEENLTSQEDNTSQNLTSQEELYTQQGKNPRPYNKTDRSILELIDEHLANLPNDKTGYRIKPSLAFDQFTALHNDCSEYKKTYKNRFYMKEKHIIAGRR